MPETMVERIARDIMAKVNDAARNSDICTGKDLARIALEALREPTEAMVKAGTIPTREIWLGNGTTATGLGLGADQGTIFRRMIDAALSEGAER